MKWVYVLILLGVSYCSGLGWHDVCNMTNTINTCYVWPHNPAPYNQIESFTRPGSMCDHSCKLILSSAPLPCVNLTDCARHVSGVTSHHLLDTVNIKSHSIAIQSHSAAEKPATIIFPNNMGQSCTMFKVQAKEAIFSNLVMNYQTLCLTDDADYPINQVPLIFQQETVEKTSITLNTIETNGKIATVAVLGTTGAALNLNVKKITKDASADHTFPVLLLNTNITEIMCDDYTALFYLSQFRDANYKVPTYPNCVNFLKSDYAAVYSGIEIDPFQCKKTVIKENPCAKLGPQLTILFIVFIVLASGGLIFLAAQYFHPGHYFLDKARRKNTQPET